MRGIYLQNAGLSGFLPLAIAVFGAIFFMNNLSTARSTFKDQLAIVGRKHTWIMSYIYVGTFGSFIGYSAAFPLLIKTQFPAVTIGIAFLGPLVGSLSRPLGGLLADKVGGAIVTFWNFIAMGAATIGVVYFVEYQRFHKLHGGLPGPLCHHRDRQRFDLPYDPVDLPGGGASRQQRAWATLAGHWPLKTSSIESAAALGFIGAIGACGGYLIPRGFGASIGVTGGPHLALAIYLAFYATCLALTWWFYLRKSSLAASAPSLAEARV